MREEMPDKDKSITESWDIYYLDAITEDLMRKYYKDRYAPYRHSCYAIEGRLSKDKVSFPYLFSGRNTRRVEPFDQLIDVRNVIPVKTLVSSVMLAGKISFDAAVMSFDAILPASGDELYIGFGSRLGPDVAYAGLRLVSGAWYLESQTPAYGQTRSPSSFTPDQVGLIDGYVLRYNPPFLELRQAQTGVIADNLLASLLIPGVHLQLNPIFASLDTSTEHAFQLGTYSIEAQPVGLVSELAYLVGNPVGGFTTVNTYAYSYIRGIAYEGMYFFSGCTTNDVHVKIDYWDGNEWLALLAETTLTAAASFVEHDLTDEYSLMRFGYKSASPGSHGELTVMVHVKVRQ